MARGRKGNKKMAAPVVAEPILPVIRHEDGRIEIPIHQVQPNPEQPREVFDPKELAALSQSILNNGVIQPIVVEPVGDGTFLLHDGERRLRASKMAGLKTIPAVISPALNGNGQKERLIRALVANIQRADLGPIEEARSYQKLIEMGYTRNQIGLELGISSARVASRLMLLLLDEPIQTLIEEGRLAKDNRLVDALLEIPDANARVKMARTLANRNATIKAGVEACARLAKTLQAERIGADEAPALRLSQQKAGTVRRPMWDAFAQVGKVPPWPLMEIATRDTCNRCGLRDVASATTCKGCALVELLREMIGSTQ